MPRPARLDRRPKAPALPPLTHAEVIRRLRREIDVYGSQRLAARGLGVSVQLLSYVVKGQRGVGPKLLRALKLKHVRIVMDRYEEL